MKRHIRVKHQDGKPHLCPSCPKRFRDLTKLREHLRTIHHGERFRCNHEDCEREYKSKRGLQVHIKTHNKKYTIICELCGKGFMDRSNLDGHINSKHMSSKPYKCSKCNASFSWISNLRRHRKKCKTTAGPQVPVQCHACKKVFKHKSSLKRHMKSHTSRVPAQLISSQWRLFCPKN